MSDDKLWTLFLYMDKHELKQFISMIEGAAPRHHKPPSKDIMSCSGDLQLAYALILLYCHPSCRDALSNEWVNGKRRNLFFELLNWYGRQWIMGRLLWKKNPSLCIGVEWLATCIRWDMSGLLNEDLPLCDQRQLLCPLQLDSNLHLRHEDPQMNISLEEEFSADMLLDSSIA